MSYERDAMLKGIVDTSWCEMDAYAARVVRLLGDRGDLTRFSLADAMVAAAKEEKAEDAERKRLGAIQKSAGGEA